MSIENNNGLSTQLMGLPILKHFNEDEIKTQVNSFKKGEKGIFWFLKLAAIGAIGYGLWIYVLPTVFRVLGQLIAGAATAIIIVFFVIAAPSILKWLRILAKNLAKAAIRQDPFGELEKQRGKMLENQQQFRIAKGKISTLRSDMEAEASKSETDAKKMQSDILKLQVKAQNLKIGLDTMVKEQGIAAKGTDEYVNNQAELTKVLSDSQRIGNKMTQSKDFVQKYGSRAAIMKKFGQKLVMVETSMEIKVLDFDATIEILKKDFEFAQKSRQATETAKSAMLFTKDWELEYALDVVASTIAQDISITAGNLKDIDSLTNQYAMDSDELYSNLNTLADDIKVGNNSIPEAKSYSNPEYQLTQSDKLKSGGFEDIM